jgi:Arc/MetJ-type ribon-helix-helix transcriptional regulator
MAQLVTRIPDALADDLDRLVAEGVVASRSEGVRLGLQRLVDRERRRRIGQAIVDGYTRMPQTDDELLWTDEDTRKMIEEEPW